MECRLNFLPLISSTSMPKEIFYLLPLCTRMLLNYESTTRQDEMKQKKNPDTNAGSLVKRFTLTFKGKTNLRCIFTNAYHTHRNTVNCTGRWFGC